MKVTVCELPDQPEALEEAFEGLVQHVQGQKSDMLLLPEMPFYPWIGATQNVDAEKWKAAVDAHEEWLMRVAALGVDFVLGSRPTLEKDVPHNDAFIWDKKEGARFAHRKYYLPDEPGFWEATWYRRADQPGFKVASAGDTRVGFMICSDMWFGEHARRYARQGVHILATPRATERSSVEKWLAGGRAIAVMAGAYGLSSNRSGESQGISWGGSGWIVDPDGEVLARTKAAEPFATADIDLERAEAAKHSYPRDVKE